MSDEGEKAGGAFTVGCVVAGIVSWSVNHSILWCLVHAWFSWLYVIYYIAGCGHTP